MLISLRGRSSRRGSSNESSKRGFRPSTVSADGVTLDPTWLGWLERTADEARKLEPVAEVSWLEMRTYMASTLLRDTDAVSMAQSLEVRVPLLDTPLVEFVGSLPDAARWRPGTQKALLAEALGDLLPPEILGQKETHVHSAVGRVAARTIARGGWKRASATPLRRLRLICVRAGCERFGRIFLPGKRRGRARGRYMC